MWSIVSWVKNFLSDYIWFWWPSNDMSTRTILLIGLDDAGKTTLTGLLTQNRLIQSTPTSQPSNHHIKIGSTQLCITDVGGHVQARRLWRDYMFASTRLIFMIDVSNRDRLHEARRELWNLLKDDEIKRVPLLILGNKIDNIHTALSQTELVQYLQIDSYLNAENSLVKLSMCSLMRNEGFSDGLRWLIAQKIQSD